MSFESGRSLGYKASLIMIITPAIMGALAFAVMLAAFSSIFQATSGVTPGTSTSIVFWFVPLIAVIVAAAVVAFIGYVMFMVAMHRLSNYYSERGIFSNLLWALIIQLLGGALAAVAYVIFIFSSIGSIAQAPPSMSPSIFTSIFVGYGLIILVTFALSIVGGVLYWRAFTKLAEKSGVDNFRTAGLLYLIGAVIPFIGFVAWIGWIFAALGYRKMVPTPPVTYAAPPMPVSPSAVKRCPNCGAENSPDAHYCRVCGRQL